MKPVSLIGILLIVLGALALAYQGINYTREKNIVDMGAMHVTSEEHDRISLPPILRGLALVGVVVLLVAGTKNKSKGGIRNHNRPRRDERGAHEITVWRHQS